MPIEVTMPRLSDTMQQGTIVKWNVTEGQKVKSGDVIADIETDKATMELQSFDDGVVASLAVPAGQSVPVGTIIMRIAGAGEDPAAVKAAGGAAAEASGGTAGASAGSSGSQSASGVAAASSGAQGSSGKGTAVAPPPTSQTSAQPSSQPGAKPGTQADVNGRSGDDRVFASPLAKKIAAETGVDLSRVQGSGPGGRIVRRDVEDAVAGAAAEPARRAGQGASSASAQPMGAPARAAQPGELVPLSNMRRVIAQRLVESKTTIPHYQVSVDVDMDSLLTLRTQLNEQLEGQGVKLSVNDFLVRACALAMREHPFVNSRWAEQGGQAAIQQLADVNIGVAIALPMERGGGLVVGTVRQADVIGLRAISAESKRLGEKARAKGLTPEEMSDSTFTISNLGMFGVTHFTAIINPPNVAILAVGAALDRPVVRNGQVVVGNVMTMTMSSDHRVVDGAMAARYLASVKGMLEKPAALLV